MSVVRVTHSLTLDLAASAGTSNRVHLLPPSGFSGRDGRGPYVYDFETLKARAIENGMPIPVDYEHQSLDAMAKTEPTPAAGWSDPRSWTHDEFGTWGEIRWTPRAGSYVENKEYGFISPVFEHLPNSPEILALVGAGLTNNPNLHLVAINKKNAESSNYTPGNQPPDVSTHMREQLLKLLGLGADATDDAVVAAVTAAADAQTHAAAAAAEFGAATPAEIVSAANSRHATTLATYVPKTDYEAMSARATTAETALAAHTAAAREAEVDAIVATATAAGKLTPAQSAHAKKVGMTDVQLLKDLVESAPVVPGTGPSNVSAHSKAGEKAPTAEQLASAKAVGVSVAALTNYLNKKD